MTNSPAPPPGGASGAAPAASALMAPTVNEIGLPVETPASHAAAHATREKYNRAGPHRELLLRGDAHARAEFEAAGRVLRTSTRVEIGGQEQIQHADAVSAGFDAYVGVPLADVYGGELGAAIAAEQNARSPIPLGEHHQAKALLEELKFDADFQRRLRAGDVRAKARWSLVHRQITRPSAEEK